MLVTTVNALRRVNAYRHYWIFMIIRVVRFLMRCGRLVSSLGMWRSVTVFGSWRFEIS